MDPLSITSSAITLLTVLGAVVKKIQSLRAASDELRKTVEDLSDFRQIVSHTSELITDHEADIPASQRDTLSALLKEAGMKVGELQEIVVYHTERSVPFGNIKASKFAWAKPESEVAALRARFVRMRLSLAALLSSMTMSCTLKLARTVKESSQVVADSRTAQESLHAEIDYRLSAEQLVFIWHDVGSRYMQQPMIQLDLIGRNLLSPGTYVSNDYTYLEDIIGKWHSDTTTAFVKVLPYHAIPNFEIRVRKFCPTNLFRPLCFRTTFDDIRGWVPCSPVWTMPWAIPQTRYVECGRLQLWAAENYRWKLLVNKYVPGRALLAVVMCQDPSIFKHHMLLRSAFTFAALSWVATSPLHATRSPNNAVDEFSMEPRQRSLVPRLENINVTSSECLTDLFATDEDQGISTCPTAVGCQISLLSYERAQELEHDILLNLQELLDKADNDVNSADTFFVIYCTLALLMDAYEYYVMAFRYDEVQLERCVHLVECLTFQIERLLRGASILDILRREASADDSSELPSLARQVERNLQDPGNSKRYLNSL